jgi:hypothetical protein
MSSLHYEFKEGIGRWAYLKSRRDFLFKVSRLDYNFVPEEVHSTSCTSALLVCTRSSSSSMHSLSIFTKQTVVRPEFSRA